MTTDERIEKLVERHEALAQTVERLTHPGIQQGERLEKQGEHLERQSENIDKLTEQIRMLANVAASHEERLDTIEGNRP